MKSKINIAKKVTANLLFAFIIIVSNILNLEAQSPAFQSLGDATGLPINNQLIQEAANKLRNAFPDSFRNQFAVFDAGFYAEIENYQNFDYVKSFEGFSLKAKQLSKYYLLIGRINTTKTLNDYYLLELNLPTTGKFSCLTNIKREKLDKIIIENVTNPIAENNGISITDNLLLAILKEAQVQIEDIIDCCDVIRGQLCPIEDLLEQKNISLAADWSPFLFNSLSIVIGQPNEVIQGAIPGIYKTKVGEFENHCFFPKFDNNNEFLGYRNLDDNIYKITPCIPKLQDSIYFYEYLGGCELDQSYIGAFKDIKYELSQKSSFESFKSKLRHRGSVPCFDLEGEGDGSGTVSNIIVYNSIGLSKDSVQKLIRSLIVVNNTNKNNFFCRLYLTNLQTPTSKIDSIQNIINAAKDYEIILWVNYKGANNTNPTFTFSNIVAQNSMALAFVQYFVQLVPKIEFNPFIAILDGLANLIGKAIIPEKYYNPDKDGYNPILAEIGGLVGGQSVTIGLSELINGNYNNKYSAVKAEFAFSCGLWNGAIGLASDIPGGMSALLTGIPDGTSFIIDLYCGENGAKDKFNTVFSLQTLQQLKKVASDSWKHSTSNVCMQAYTSGQVVFFCVSSVLSAAKIGKVGAALSILDRVDIMGTLLSKAIGLAGKTVKVVLVDGTKVGIKVLKYTLKGTGTFIGNLNITKISSKSLACAIPPVDIGASETTKNAYETIKNLSNSNISTKLNDDAITTYLKNDDGDFVQDINNCYLATVKEGVEEIPVIIGEKEIIEKIAKEVVESFNLSTFLNLKAKIPTGGKLTYLKKSNFANDGYKVKVQKEIIDDIKANGDDFGKKTEGLVDDIMVQNGYEPLDGKYGSNNGYDGIYIKGDINNPTEIIIIESKQFSYTNGVAGGVTEHKGINLNGPNFDTGLPSQMSDKWIQYVQDKLRTDGKTSVANMIRDFDNKIIKYVAAIDKTQGELNFLKLGIY